MTRRKLQDKNIRKLTRMGTKSLGLSLPAEMVHELRWREKQKVTVKKQGKRLVVEDWKK